VVVGIVTHNSAPYLESCLFSLKQQTHPNLRICLWDNASSDQTVEIVAEYAGFFHATHFSNSNLGFCAGHNRIIASEPSDYVLVLNPDVTLDARYVEILVHALNQDASAGSATGKLWRRWSPPEKKIIDTTGIYFTPSQRHLDRGAGETDSGQYERREYVFGASGAAALYRRSMLEDIKAGAEYFDEAFFAYREDADLAWRAQWLGWRCLYVPEAMGFHVRRVLPERRASLPPEINMHSLKNRFLMRVKNMDPGTYGRFFLSITARDMLALGYMLLREWYSLRAIPLFFRAFPRAWAVRRALRRHRRASPKEIRSWFSYQPVARPAP
jgi:GT2 family glycosyltransferase